MAPAGRGSKAEYNKPRLKEQIDAAMAAFLKAGRAVERIPSVLISEPPPPAPAEAAGKDEDDEGEEANDEHLSEVSETDS